MYVVAYYLYSHTAKGTRTLPCQVVQKDCNDHPHLVDMEDKSWWIQINKQMQGNGHTKKPH